MPKSRKRKTGNAGRRQLSPPRKQANTPSRIDALFDQGIVKFQQGQHEDSEMCFRQILDISPDNAEAYNMIGVIGLSVGRPDLALEYFESAAQHQGDNADYWMNQSIALLEMGALSRAIQAAEQATKLNPAHARAWNTLGLAHKALNDWNAAKGAFLKSIEMDQRFGEPWINLCGVLQELGEFDEAVKAGQKSVALCPQFPESHYNLGSAKQALSLNDEAVAHYQKSIDLNPDYFDAHINLSKCLINLERYPEAEELARKAINLNPDHESGYVNLGLTFCATGKLREGVSEYYEAIKRNPNAPEPHTNLGFTLLALEEFSSGWDEYEYGFLTGSRGPVIDTPTPVWQGQPLNGKLIHVYGEQGIGDQIMYATMLQDIIDQGADIILECESRLIPLFERAFPDISVVALSQPPNPDTRVPEEDYRTPIGSLGRWLRRSVNDFTPHRQYLYPDPELVQKYRDTYSRLGDGPTIGISWKSNSPNFSHNKSIAIEQWRPILETPGCQFVSLQYGDIEEDIRKAKQELGVDIFVDPAVSAINSLEQSAAQISAVDLVISISNATIHFAGSCGVKTWVLLGHTPLWHWFVNREDSLWYDSVRCLRCPSENDWEPIIDQAARDLKKFIASCG